MNIENISDCDSNCFFWAASAEREGIMSVREMSGLEKIERLKKIIAERKNGSNWFYLIINHIDPDSLAAAFGMKHLLKRLGVERVRILFVGEAGHEQNVFIIYGMDLRANMTKLSEVVAGFTDKDIFVLLDSSSPQDGRLKDSGAMGKFVPLIIIDHHRSDNHEEETDDNFIWIEDRGSCASMIVELLEQISFDFHEKTDDDLPILLALGIYGDTSQLVYADQADVAAYGKIINYCDGDRLQAFVNYPVSSAFVEALQAALNNRVEQGSIVVTSVGLISSANQAHIAQIADEQIRRSGITLAIVWGWLDGKILYISARSADSTAPLSEFLHSRFGGNGGAKLLPGGRVSSGGAQIAWDAGVINSPASLPHLLKAIEAWVNNRVFNYQQ